jgi:hypothetical protein
VIGVTVLLVAISACGVETSVEPRAGSKTTKNPDAILEQDPSVPRVQGLRVANAKDELRNAAPWDIIVKHRTTANGTAGEVLRQTPRPGRSLAEGKRLVLLVARVPLPEPPPIPPPPGGGGSGGGGSGCDGSYPSTCIPVYPPDLDCPQVNATNFTVVGSDPHGFDGDSDGIGCET